MLYLHKTKPNLTQVKHYSQNLQLSNELCVNWPLVLSGVFFEHVLWCALRALRPQRGKLTNHPDVPIGKLVWYLHMNTHTQIQKLNDSTFFAEHLELLQGQCSPHKTIPSEPTANTFMQPLLSHKLTAMLHCTITGNSAGNWADQQRSMMEYNSNKHLPLLLYCE